MARCLYCDNPVPSVDEYCSARCQKQDQDSTGQISIVREKWPTNLFLIRHGQSERNIAKAAAKASGQKFSYADAIRDQDTPLTSLGKLQSLSAGEGLRQCGYKVDITYVSPYLRAVQSADMFSRGLGFPPNMKGVVDERIRELEFGILDGLTPDGIAAKYPEEIARRTKEGKYWYRPPGGENRPDVNLRIHSFLGTLTRSARGKNVAVICHSVVVMCFRHLLERWGETDYLKVDAEDDVRNGSVTRYQSVGNKLHLRNFNHIFYEE